MKWITTDYKGNPQVWYSGDVIEKIMRACKESGLIEHRDYFGALIAHTANPLAAKIIRIIEGEE